MGLLAPDVVARLVPEVHDRIRGVLRMRDPETGGAVEVHVGDAAGPPPMPGVPVLDAAGSLAYEGVAEHRADGSVLLTGGRVLPPDWADSDECYVAHCMAVARVAGHTPGSPICRALVLLEACAPSGSPQRAGVTAWAAATSEAARARGDRAEWAALRELAESGAAVDRGTEWATLFTDLLDAFGSVNSAVARLLQEVGATIGTVLDAFGDFIGSCVSCVTRFVKSADDITRCCEGAWGDMKTRMVEQFNRVGEAAKDCYTKIAAFFTTVLAGFAASVLDAVADPLVAGLVSLSRSATAIVLAPVANAIASALGTLRDDTDAFRETLEEKYAEYVAFVDKQRTVMAYILAVIAVLIGMAAVSFLSTPFVAGGVSRDL